MSISLGERMSLRDYIRHGYLIARRRIRATYNIVAYKFPVLPPLREMAFLGRSENRLRTSKYFDYHPLKDESATLHAIWAVELITPSQLKRSSRKIARVDWNASIGTNDGANDWVERNRNISSGGWKNLGSAAPIGKNWLGLRKKFRRFPKSFEYANFHAIKVTPSVSAIVGCFFLSRENRSAYQDIFKSHHFQRAIPQLDGSIAIHDPWVIKKGKIQQLRETLRGEVSEFMARNFGGFFTSHDRSRITTVEVLEFSPGVNARFREAFYDDIRSWSGSLNDLIWSTSREAPVGHSVMSFTSRSFEGQDFEVWGGENVDALISRLSFSLPSNWTMLAVTELLSIYDEIISRVRDAEFRPLTSFRKSGRVLTEEKAHEMMDIELVTAEITQERLSWLASQMHNFTMESPSRSGFHSLPEQVMEQILQRAEAVKAHHRNIVDARRAINETYAMFEMARIARFSLVATFVSALIAGLALLFAFSKNWKTLF
ncbi:hypothetical protein K3163_06815 [Qipengyuania sp. 1NDW9]|uniref:hypothetical protein n=1 Tax=Qipengyuania xiapuensis TaxID=2867236 RepID=UPI001C88D597|nr:hypothetical protein [Qipengyuania xiapuensis]MBX7492915.1 hypothetical protein [Qipengyuania xiapuensis]